MHKRQWLEVEQIDLQTRKNDLHPKKIMLSFRWRERGVERVKGITHRKLLLTVCVITADLCSGASERVAAKLERK